MVYDWFTMFLQSSALPVFRRWPRDRCDETGASGVRMPLVLELADLEAAAAGSLPEAFALIVEGEVDAIEAASARLAQCLPDAILLLRATPMAVQRLHVALCVVEAQAGAPQGRIAILAQLGADPSVFLGGTRYADLSSRLVALVFNGAQLRQRLSGPRKAQAEEGRRGQDKKLEASMHPISSSVARLPPAADQEATGTGVEASLSPFALAQAQTLLMAADAGSAALLQTQGGLDEAALTAHAQAARLAGFHGLMV